MTLRQNTELSHAVATLAPPGVLTGYRIISTGDDRRLIGEENLTFQNSAPMRRRASAATRIVARQLMERLGYAGMAIPHSVSGVPAWPTGIVGSLAHDDKVAVAAVSSTDNFWAIGIDVEPVDSLPAELIELVATPAERRRYPAALLKTSLLFSAKEAVYKALNPLDGVFLNFHDVEIDVEAKEACIRSRRKVALSLVTGSRVLALAYISSP